MSTCSYDDIRKVQVTFACQKTVATNVAAGVLPYVARVAAGELVNCEQVIADLLVKLAEAVNPVSVPTVTNMYPKCTSCRTQFSSGTMYCSYCGGNRSFNWS